MRRDVEVLYRTSDGKTWEFRAEALIHQEKLDLTAEFAKSKIFPVGTDLEALAKWFLANFKRKGKS